MLRPRRGRYQTAAPWPPSFLFYQIYIFQRLNRRRKGMKCHVPQHTKCAGSIHPSRSFKTGGGRKRERWTTRQDPVVGCPSATTNTDADDEQEGASQQRIRRNVKKINYAMLHKKGRE